MGALGFHHTQQHGEFQMSDTVGFKKNIPWLYFLALFAQTMGNMLFTMYLIFYITERMLIGVVLMGTIMLLTRIVDGIFGVLAGIIVQKTSLKHGQYRSWLLYTPFIIGIGNLLLFFNPAIPQAVKLIQIFVGYMAVGASMSFAQVSQNGLMSRIAGPDIAKRLAITAKITQAQQTARIISAMVAMPMILFFETFGVDGYTVTQIIFVIFGVLGQLPLFFKTREYEGYDPNFKQTGAGSVKIGALFAETLKNGQLIILMIADALRYCAYLAITSVAAYYFRYVIQDMGKLTIALTIQGVCGLLGAMAGQLIPKKLGKRPTAILVGLLSTGLYTGLAIFGNAGWEVWLVCVSGAVFLASVIASCGVNFYLDCAEYHLFKTGKDNKAFTMSMYGVSIKIAFALSSVAIAYLLGASGYDGAANSVENIRLMVLLIGGIHGGCNLAYALLMLTYGITEEKARKYAEHNHQATLQAAARS
jgi:Na+/melibiose symporter-like transporter